MIYTVGTRVTLKYGRAPGTVRATDGEALHTVHWDGGGLHRGYLAEQLVPLVSETSIPGLDTAEYWGSMSAGPVPRRDVHPTVVNGAQDTRSAWVRELGEQSFSARRPLTALDYAKRIASLLNEAAAAGYAVATWGAALCVDGVLVEDPPREGQSWTVAE